VICDFDSDAKFLYFSLNYFQNVTTFIQNAETNLSKKKAFEISFENGKYFCMECSGLVS